MSGKEIFLLDIFLDNREKYQKLFGHNFANPCDHILYFVTQILVAFIRQELNKILSNELYFYLSHSRALVEKFVEELNTPGWGCNHDIQFYEFKLKAKNKH